MTKLEKLKDTKNINEFAALLNLKPKSLAYILYIMPNNGKCYESFSIPKKNGGVRIINSPNERLKLVQRRLADLLYDCYDEITKNKNGTIGLSHGFKRGYSIFTNSRKHCRKRYVFNIDIKDFFPSINFGRVRGYFINDRNFKLNEKTATIIAQIACYENQLPQGSPVSPIISNLIGNILDVKLLKLSKETKCYYSRYADDLTFSTNSKQFPSSIALENNSCWVVGEKLNKTIEKSGFKINETKVTMQYKYSRQTCVGLIVNRKVNVRKDYYRKVRAMCHNLLKTNTFYIDNDDEENSISQLGGMINFIFWIKQHYFKQKTKDKKEDLEAIKKLYRKFLFYKYFVNLERPLIITEGKSDITYLKCAMKNLIESYPDLIEHVDDKYNFKISFFNMTKIIRKVLIPAEGTSGLLFLMRHYKEEISKYNFPNVDVPIIIIVDNDDGVKEIKKLLEIQNPMPIYQPFFKQLYVLFVSNQEKIVIEDLFDEKTREIEIEGKVFNPKKTDKDEDNDKYFGKIRFSQKVILPNYKTINFENFKPILDNIRQIIAITKK